MYFEFLERPRQGATWNPTVDVCERPTEIVVFVEMPGVDRADIQLAWNDGLLIISGLILVQGPVPRPAASSQVAGQYGIRKGTEDASVRG